MSNQRYPPESNGEAVHQGELGFRYCVLSLSLIHI